MYLLIYIKFKLTTQFNSTLQLDSTTDQFNGEVPCVAERRITCGSFACGGCVWNRRFELNHRSELNCGVELKKNKLIHNLIYNI